MADQDAGKQAKELVEATKTLSAAQAEIAGLLRHVVQKALLVMDTELRDMRSQFHAQMVKLTAMIAARYGNERPQ